MNIITKRYVTEGQEFVLFSDISEGRRYYGTIPYSNIDENGRMIQAMNGAQMLISFESAAEAMQSRTDAIIFDRLIKKHEQAGLSFDDALLAAIREQHKSITQK